LRLQGLNTKLNFYNLRILELNTKFNFGRQKHNAMIVPLKTNNLSLCLNREYLKSVLNFFLNNHRKLHIYVITFAGKYFIKIEQKLTLE
jgi:hypothetical protein